MALANPRYVHRARPPAPPASIEPQHREEAPLARSDGSRRRPSSSSLPHPPPLPALPPRRPRGERHPGRPRVRRVSRLPLVLDATGVREVRAVPARAVFFGAARGSRVSSGHAQPARVRARVRGAVLSLAERADGSREREDSGGGGGGGGRRRRRRRRRTGSRRRVIGGSAAGVIRRRLVAERRKEATGGARPALCVVGSSFSLFL